MKMRLHTSTLSTLYLCNVWIQVGFYKSAVKSHGRPKTRLFGFVLHNPKREFAVSERNFVNFWIVWVKENVNLCA
jgi:hypothetical protein